MTVEIEGGKKLAKALEDISNKVKRGASLKVGFLSGATYPDGTPVAMIAAIQNFGAPSRGIPPRPFFSNMIADKSHEWGPAIAGLLPEHGFDGAAVLELAGQAIAGQLRQSIVDTNTPPLSPVTLMLRKMQTDNPDLKVGGKTVGEAAQRVAAGESYGGVSTKPLVWTGVLLNSVDYKVESGS